MHTKQLIHFIAFDSIENRNIVRVTFYTVYVYQVDIPTSYRKIPSYLFLYFIYGEPIHIL